ncbi:LysR family transcriptional regulator [Thiospirochaeta perfilievii]|uniref:LysR family transcriptional regulator n=1 Tax=Thiospirochaeta perfilievii TaxID=252967 RepID=A0A5C1QF77_9SPIO|nr:LysR family transcriptional regulator [Thiospirochaeta perfilievii]QEN05304.1 LysR family transcriptional regulator [Thiospirochaeta perfilievii]
MDFRDLVFLSVAEFRSFTKASKELYISQPAVTKHIKELEESLGCKLFNRNGPNITLTEEGKTTYFHLNKIKRDYRELYNNLTPVGETTKSEINIGCSTTVSNYIIPGILADYAMGNKGVRLNMLSGNSLDIEKKLLNNVIDLILVENSSSSSGITYLNYLEDEIIAVCGRGTLYSKQRSISKNEIKTIPIITRESGSGTLEVINNEIQDKFNIQHTIGSSEGIKRFLKNFNGLALISNKAVTYELNRGELVKIDIDGLKIKRSIRIGYRKGHLPPTIKRLIDFIRHYNF